MNQSCLQVVLGIKAAAANLLIIFILQHSDNMNHMYPSHQTVGNSFAPMKSNSSL